MSRDYRSCRETDRSCVETNRSWRRRRTWWNMVYDTGRHSSNGGVNVRGHVNSDASDNSDVISDPASTRPPPLVYVPPHCRWAIPALPYVYHFLTTPTYPPSQLRRIRLRLRLSLFSIFILSHVSFDTCFICTLDLPFFPVSLYTLFPTLAESHSFLFGPPARYVSTLFIWLSLNILNFGPPASLT